MEQDDDNQGLVLGIVFFIIALVIALVIGLGIFVSGSSDTPAALAAVAEGAEIAEVGEPLVKLYFDSGKAELPVGSDEALVKLIVALEADPHKLVLISGYHDESGSVEANAELTMERALVVKAALLGAGVPADRLQLRKPALIQGGSDQIEAWRVEVRVQ